MSVIRSFVVRHKRGVTFVGLLLLSFLLLFTTGKDLGIRPKEIGQSVLSLLQLSVTGVSKWVTGTVNSISELRKARNELEVAREKLLEYERISRDIVRLRQENQRLRELLNFSEEMEYQGIQAELIAKQPGNGYQLLVLNKGTRNGVSRFLPVVAQHKGWIGLVGKVITVGLTSCAVLPLTNEESFVAGRLERSRNEGMINGRGEENDQISMLQVPRDALKDIEYGDLVITSGLGQVFPKNIPIGRVRGIQSKAYETSLELSLETVIDFSRLEYMLILTADGTNGKEN